MDYCYDCYNGYPCEAYFLMNAFKTVCLFLAFAIFASFAGFGIFQVGGTFTETFHFFGDSLSTVNSALFSPMNTFLSYFGLASSYGGTAFVFKRSSDDVIYSPYITDNVEYISVVTSFDTRYDNKLYNPYALGFDSVIPIIFYDEFGNYIRSLIKFDGKIYTDLIDINNGRLGLYLDPSNSFFNPISKYEYVDISFDLMMAGDIMDSYRFNNDSSLESFKFAGTLFDAQGWLY